MEGCARHFRARPRRSQRAKARLSARRSRSKRCHVPRIERKLSADARSRVRKLEVLAVTESTNSRLFALSDLPAGRADVCIAEFQSAGRGRRGRSWTAPYGGGLCLSVSWQFADSPKQVGALSLATGVGVLRALREQGVGGIGLKWPNDIVCRGRKLGGILIELRTETAGPAYVVLGVGLNFHLSKQAQRAIQASGVAAVDLAEIGASATTGRNLLAAGIINQHRRGADGVSTAGISTVHE